MTLFVNEFELFVLKSFYCSSLKSRGILFKYFYYLFCLLRSIFFDLDYDGILFFMLNRFSQYVDLFNEVCLALNKSFYFFSFEVMEYYFFLRQEVESFIFLLRQDKILYNVYVFIISDANSLYLTGSSIFNSLYKSMLSSNVFFLNSLLNVYFLPEIYMGSGCCYYKGYLYISHYLRLFDLWCLKNSKVSILIYLQAIHLYLGLVEYYNRLGFFKEESFMLILNKYVLDICEINSFKIKDSVSYPVLFSYFSDVVVRLIYLLDIKWYKKKYGTICF